LIVEQKSVEIRTILNDQMKSLVIKHFHSGQKTLYMENIEIDFYLSYDVLENLGLQEYPIHISTKLSLWSSEINHLLHFFMLKRSVLRVLKLLHCRKIRKCSARVVITPLFVPCYKSQFSFHSNFSLLHGTKRGIHTKK